MGRPSNSGTLLGGIAAIAVVGVLLYIISHAILPLLFLLLAIRVLFWAGQAINGRGRSSRRRRK